MKKNSPKRVSTPPSGSLRDGVKRLLRNSRCLNGLKKTSHLNSIRAFGDRSLTICHHRVFGEIEFRNSLGKPAPTTDRSESLLSNKAPGILPLLRDLKPRLLEGLTPSQLKSVLAEARYRKFPANRVITNQDHPAEHLYLLLTGRARFFFVTEKGQEVILLWIPPGEIFGSAALLPTPTGYHVSAAAIRSCSALVWDRSTIRRRAALYPTLLENAFYLTLHYLYAYRAAHEALISNTSQERLAHVLVSLPSGIGEKVAGGVELKIRNEELANEANVSLFAVSRLISEWHRTGLLLKGRGKILLRSPEYLLRHATESTRSVKAAIPDKHN